MYYHYVALSLFSWLVLLLGGWITVCGRLLIHECDSKRVFMFDWGVLIRDQDYWYAERGCLFLFWVFPGH